MSTPVIAGPFDTEILRKKILDIKARDEDVQLTYDLRRLSNKLLLGEKVDMIDRFVAGAAISHLLALVEAS